MTMSVYLIFPDLGNTKIAHLFFVGSSLPTPCAVFMLCSCDVCVRVCAGGCRGRPVTAVIETYAGRG